LPILYGTAEAVPLSKAISGQTKRGLRLQIPQGLKPLLSISSFPTAEAVGLTKAKTMIEADSAAMQRNDKQREPMIRQCAG
jgi:hypothetical protein